MIPEWLNQLNAFAWVTSNIIVLYIAIVLTLFVVAYYVFFDPSATTGGKLIFRFALSLLGVMGLIFIGVFINPAANREWFTYSGDIFWWRPLLRLGFYAYVAYSITSLTIFLGIRKFRPDLLTTVKDVDLVQPRKLD